MPVSQDSSQERTEAPTPRRRDEARRKGQVARSNEASNAVSMLGTALGLWCCAASLGRYLIQIVRSELSSLDILEFTIPSATRYFAGVLVGAIQAVGPMLAIVALVVLLGAAAQSGFSLTYDALTPNWTRISPIKGWQRLFSLTSVMRGLIFGIKLTGLIAVSTWLTISGFDSWVTISHFGLRDCVIETWDITVVATFVFAGLMFGVGSIDYAYQWWRNEQELKMSVQQLRDEQKEHDGDPKVKQKIRSMQREVAKLRMLREVPSATVVLTNPTHIAVALRYDRGVMVTPVVVAKGTGAFAKRIAKIARENDIPVLERKPLARLLYASVEVNDEIPVTLYKAVAEILAYVYRVKRSA